MMAWSHVRVGHCKLQDDAKTSEERGLARSCVLVARHEGDIKLYATEVAIQL